jgi:hypothetical protein
MRAKNNRVLASVIAVVAMLSVLLWFNAVRVRRNHETSQSAMAATRLRLEAEVLRAEKKLADLHASRAPLATGAGDSAPTPASEKPAFVPTPPPALSPADNAVLEVLQLEAFRASVVLNHGDFFRQMRLTPEQIQKFQHNHVARHERRMDLAGASWQMDEAGKRTVAELQKKADADYEAAQAELLGPEGYRQLQEYLRTMSVRNSLIRGFAGSATMAGIPLSGEQSDGLMAAAIAAVPNGATLPSDHLLGSIDWKTFDAKAREILTPAQFKLFMTETPSVGYQSHWKYRLDAAVTRAKQAESALNHGNP